MTRAFPRSASRFLVLHGLAALAGLSAARLGVPLPWMIGPMVLAAIASLRRTRVEVPQFTRPVGQLIVAAVVGASFTPAALKAAMDHFMAMLVVSAALPVLAVAAGLLLRRMTRIDVMTASLASIPGGPAEMSALAVRYGADPAVVALVQTIRIFVLVLTLPALVVAVDGSVNDRAALHGWGIGDAAGALLLLTIALSGGIAFHVCRLTSPFFLGALAFTAAASVLDAPISMPPDGVLAAAQVLLGVWLGTMFDRALILEGRRFVVAALVSTLVLMALAIALALVVAASAGIHWETMVLATAPGGVTEMALTARLLHQDVATVTAFQVARIFTTLALAPVLLSLSLWLVRAGRRRRDPDGGA